MRLSFLFLVFSIGLSVNAQDEPVAYTVLKDDAQDTRLIKFTLPIWNLTLSDYNFSALDIVGGVHVVPSKNLYFHAAYRYMIGDQMNNDLPRDDNSTNNASSIYESEISNELSVEGTYFFKQEIIRKEQRINLKSQSVGGTRMTYISYIPAQTIKSYGIRLGFDKGVSWYDLTKVQLTGTNVFNGSQVTIDNGYRSTFLNYSTARVGVALSKATNLHVDVKDYGYRTNTGITLFYADLLIPLSRAYDDVYYSASVFNGSYNNFFYQQLNINDNIKNLPAGLAIGARILPYMGAVGFNAELGLQPFAGFTGVYSKIGFNFMIGKGQKRLMPRGRKK
jgi:hypothetical protein